MHLPAQVPDPDQFLDFEPLLPFGIRQGLEAFEAVRQLLLQRILLPDANGNVVIGVYGHQEGAISAQLLTCLLHSELGITISFMVGGWRLGRLRDRGQQ